MTSTAARTSVCLRPACPASIRAQAARSSVWAGAARLQAPCQRGAAAAAPAVATGASGAAAASSSAWPGVRKLWASSQRAEPRYVAAASSSDAVPAASPAATTAPIPAAPSFTTHSYLWRGYKCKYATAGCGPPVLLVHGFGASSRHWRRNIGALADAGYKVYAVDLLGLGGSEKPLIDYSMELWRDQLLDFLTEYVQAPTVLVGNSIGSLAALMVADVAPQGQVAALALLNCTGGMNNKAISDDWRIKLAMPILNLIDFLLNRRPIAQRLFDGFRTPDNIRSLLLNVYGNSESVDDELVDLIYTPSCDEGALDAFVSIITGPPGPRPDRLLQGDTITQPLLVLWGDADPFTPADGPVGRFFQALPATRDNTAFTFLQGVGHCPHDDNPAAVHAELLPWLAGVHPPRS
ncbi:hypothetical protein ABPG75_009625 [Micractinium tetrahymenae]